MLRRYDSQTMNKTCRLLGACIACCIAAANAQDVNPSATLGKQRAAASKLEWEVREAGHPVLGNIRFAVMRQPVETVVGGQKVFSRAYLSCLKGTRVLAIELTNQIAPDDRKGLRQNKDPRLVCTRPDTPGSEKLVQEDLLANWDPNELGDMLSKGFRAFPLRECVSIHVVEEVALPPSWSQKSTKVEFDITPYTRQLDEVFVACGDVSAYNAPAPAPAKPVAVAAAPPQPKTPPPAPPAVKQAPAPLKPAPAAPAPAPAPAHAPVPVPVPTASAGPAPPEGWLRARALSTGGKTNVRSAPNLGSSIVIQLDPSTPVFVEKTATEWWKARSASGPLWEGFIRQDRLAFR